MDTPRCRRARGWSGLALALFLAAPIAAQDTGARLANISTRGQVVIFSLYDATLELGFADQVTTFTLSDFGRSCVPLASGTDHGWGNHQFIMGGAVQGGDVHGRMPNLTVGAGTRQTAKTNPEPGQQSYYVVFPSV